MESSLSLDNGNHIILNSDLSVNDSMNAILTLFNMIKNVTSLNATTSIMIIPGYDFRMINGMITNFHQPKSTLTALNFCMDRKHGKIFTDMPLRIISGF